MYDLIGDRHVYEIAVAPMAVTKADTALFVRRVEIAAFGCVRASDGIVRATVPGHACVRVWRWCVHVQLWRQVSGNR